MSAADMTANGGKISAGAAAKIDGAIADLHVAQRLVSALQEKEEAGSKLWHALESIDDRLHDALSKLGD